MNVSANDDTVRETKIFEIKDCALIAIATSKRAINLKELQSILTQISLDSIYYHFWGGLLQPRFEEREYNNDFAAWAWYALHDAPLGERLAVVDPNDFSNLENLRQELLEIIDERIDEKESLAYTLATSYFEFIRSQIVIFDTLEKAHNPEELTALLPDMSTSSIFYHFIDSRRRLDNQGDDFRLFLNCHGKKYEGLCCRLAAIDPYFGTLSELKKQVVEVFSAHFS
ncbi:DUF5752 family protein [Desulforhopalus sp. IMCC35007]|uniref:DUF5752 family protein n=1 Tax=Desulforhopalus sp. IMCC35007 TaxID=2569543 RepID=UPI0010AE8BEF|nr:DUF5752 family protein [Desulforhopalus sp. IMCC35007]TKB05961.1 hypothetical protein FCL48_22875 [Desulforhopalus sp. IMCC35007]